jgi:hypothetical protein
MYAVIAMACGIFFARLVAPAVERAVAAQDRGQIDEWGN